MKRMYKKELKNYGKCIVDSVINKNDKGHNLVYHKHITENKDIKLTLICKICDFKFTFNVLRDTENQFFAYIVILGIKNFCNKDSIKYILFTNDINRGGYRKCKNDIFKKENN